MNLKNEKQHAVIEFWKALYEEICHGIFVSEGTWLFITFRTVLLQIHQPHLDGNINNISKDREGQGLVLTQEAECPVRSSGGGET
jgi:hypothetical protein